MDILNISLVQVMLSVIISWALFAIFISLIQESIAQIMAERGRFLKAYLLKQLQDDSNGINWANLVYLHGAVDLLTRETNKPTNDINPRLFAEVLIEVVSSAHIVQATLQKNNYVNPTLANFKSAMQTLKQSDVTSFLRLSMSNAELQLNTTTPDAIESGIYNQLALQIENWYKEFVERVNLWYKKRMRKKLFIIGLILSIIINVDSIQLFNYFRVTPKSRTAVVNYYTEYIANTDSSHSAIDAKTAITQESLDSLVKVADLPVGFDYSIFKAYPKRNTRFFVWKIVGFIITGFAGCFGAPFWFDVLKKAYSKNIKLS